jgi:hypothetical protein
MTDRWPPRSRAREHSVAPSIGSPLEFREVIVLRTFKLSYKEISEVTGVPSAR